MSDTTYTSYTSDAAAESLAELERLTYAVSHDLSQPLTTIAGFAGLLARRYGKELDADGQEFLDFVLSGSRRMQSMIDDLVCYLRVGREEVSDIPVDCGRTVRSVLDSVASEIGGSGATVIVDELPAIKGNPAELKMLFRHLITNAIRFSEGSAPHVEVSANMDEDVVCFSIKDEGPGIDPHSTERVFELFQRLHPPDVPGTGAGLAICKRIVERHGGQIWVEQNPGGGSDFRFTIPASAHP